MSFKRKSLIWFILVLLNYWFIMKFSMLFQLPAAWLWWWYVIKDSSSPKPQELIWLERLTVHIKLLIGQEHRECPERFLLVQVHEQQCSYLTHTLAVADLKIVDTVRTQNIEQFLLLRVVPLSEHDVVSVRAVHVQVDLTDIRRPAPRQLTHLLYSIDIINPRIKKWKPKIQLALDKQKLNDITNISSKI